MLLHAASDPLGSLDEVIAAKRRLAALRRKGVPSGKAARKKQSEKATEIEVAEKEHIGAFALALSSELHTLQSIAAAEAGTSSGKYVLDPDYRYIFCESCSLLTRSP